MKFKSNAVAAALTMSAATIQPISGFVNPLSTCLWKSRTIHILGNTKSSSLDTPLGGVPSFTDDLTPKTNLGPAPKYLAHKEQMIQTVYDEWRDKYDRGAFDVDRFRIFKLNFIQAQRAHELQTYRAKLLTTGPSSRPPPPLQMNAYADCTPEEYRAIQVMEAKGEMEARKARSPEELVQLKLERQQAVEQAIRDEQERLAREAREKKPKPVPVTIRGPDGEDGDALTSFVGRSDKSKVVEEIKPHATPPAVEDMPRPVPVDMRGPDGQDGDALSSFVGKSPMKKPEMPLPPVQDKPRPVAVDYRGPGEDGAALASFAGRQVGVSIPRSQKPNEKQIDDKIPSPPKIPKEPSPKREEKASPTLEIKPPTDEIPQKDSTHKDVNEGAPKNSIALPSTKKAVKEASSISTDAPKPKKVKPRTDLSSRKAMDTTKNIPLEPAKAPEGTIHVDAKKKQVLGVKSDQEANLPADNVDPSRSNFQSKKESGVPKASPVKPMTRRVVLDPSLTSRVPSAVRPDNRVGELVERRASYFPNRPKTMAAPTASDVPLSASSKKIDDTAIFGAKSATDFPERKKDYDKFVERRAEDPFSTASKGAVTADAEAVLGTKRSATVFPKRTKNHDKATGRQAQPRPSPSSFVVKADIFTQKESATTFPKRQEMLSKLKQMKATQAATQSSTAKPSSSYVQADHHVFQDQSATSFPKRSKGVEKSPQDAATDIKPDASILSTRDATSFPKRVDSYFALVRASQFRDPPNPKAGLTADQKQMNLGAPFSFAKRGQAEDLPPPDEEDMQAASAQRQDDSTIEMSGDAYQVKEITSADDELDEKPRKRISSPFQVISRVSKSKNDDLDSPTTEAVEKSESQKPAVESNVIAPPKPRVEPPSSPMPQGPVSAEQYREAAEARLRNWRESYRALQDEFDEEGEIEEASTTDIGTIPPSVNEMVEESEEVTEEVEESPEEPRNFDGEEEAEGYQEITMRVSEVEVAAPEDDESAEAKLEDDDLEQLQNELEKAEAEADEAAAKAARQLEIEQALKADFSRAASSTSSKSTTDASRQQEIEDIFSGKTQPAPAAESDAEEEELDPKKKRQREIEQALKADFSRAASSTSSKSTSDANRQQEIEDIFSGKASQPAPAADLKAEEGDLDPKKKRQREIEQALKADFNTAAMSSRRQEQIQAVFEGRMEVEAPRPTSATGPPVDPFAVPSSRSPSVDEILKAELLAAKTLQSGSTPTTTKDPFSVSSSSSQPVPSAASAKDVLKAELEAAKTMQQSSSTESSSKEQEDMISPGLEPEAAVKDDEPNDRADNEKSNRQAKRIANAKRKAIKGKQKRKKK